VRVSKKFQDAVQEELKKLQDAVQEELKKSEDAVQEELEKALWSMVFVGVKACACVCLTVFFGILLIVYHLLNHLFGCYYCFDGLEPVPPLEIGTHTHECDSIL